MLPRPNAELPEAFVSQRHEVNPAIALSLLKDVQTTIGMCQAAQRQIIQALQMLYAQGPMVDGWLQSSQPINPDQPRREGADDAILRHGDIDTLMRYVEALEQGCAENAREECIEATMDNSTTQYQLCSLKEDGSVQSQVCPPEQMAAVSVAIARYQKFKQLMSQKQLIETKLEQAVESLTGLRNRLQQD
ncbi:MAG: hypothetical protein WBA76_03040 [Phormidesmis sp.]